MQASHRTGGRFGRGFSVIEALIATVVTTTATLGMLLILPLSFSSTDQDAIRLQATAAGQQYLDQLRSYIETTPSWTAASLPAPPSVAIDMGGVYEGSGDAAAPSGNFDMSDHQCTAVPNTKLLFDCQVTVHWSQGGMPHTVMLESYVSLQV